VVFSLLVFCAAWTYRIEDSPKPAKKKQKPPAKAKAASAAAAPAGKSAFDMLGKGKGKAAGKGAKPAAAVVDKKTSTTTTKEKTKAKGKKNGAVVPADKGGKAKAAGDKTKGKAKSTDKKKEEIVPAETAAAAAEAKAVHPLFAPPKRKRVLTEEEKKALEVKRMEEWRQRRAKEAVEQMEFYQGKSENPFFNNTQQRIFKETLKKEKLKKVLTLHFLICILH
jgi:hypothetical protein